MINHNDFMLQVMDKRTFMTGITKEVMIYVYDISGTELFDYCTSLELFNAVVGNPDWDNQLVFTGISETVYTIIEYQQIDECDDYIYISMMVVK